MWGFGGILLRFSQENWHKTKFGKRCVVGGGTCYALWSTSCLSSALSGVWKPRSRCLKKSTPNSTVHRKWSHVAPGSLKSPLLPVCSRPFILSENTQGRRGCARGTPRYKEEKSIHHHRGDPPFFLFRVWGSMVYTLLSGTMVYILFPCFPRKMVYTIAFFALWPRGRATDREKRGHAVVVYTIFSPAVLLPFISIVQSPA